MYLQLKEKKDKNIRFIVRHCDCALCGILYRISHSYKYICTSGEMKGDQNKEWSITLQRGVKRRLQVSLQLMP